MQGEKGVMRGGKREVKISKLILPLKKYCPPKVKFIFLGEKNLIMRTLCKCLSHIIVWTLIENRFIQFQCILCPHLWKVISFLTPSLFPNDTQSAIYII